MRTATGMGSPIDLSTFLRRAQARFGDHYDYSAIVYKSYKTPVRLRCRQHPVREILITPEKHLQTTGGCKFCLRASRVRQLERHYSIADASRPARQIQIQIQIQIQAQPARPAVGPLER